MIWSLRAPLPVELTRSQSIWEPWSVPYGVEGSRNRAQHVLASISEGWVSLNKWLHFGMVLRRSKRATSTFEPYGHRMFPLMIIKARTRRIQTIQSAALSSIVVIRDSSTGIISDAVRECYAVEYIWLSVAASHQSIVSSSDDSFS